MSNYPLSKCNHTDVSNPHCWHCEALALRVALQEIVDKPLANCRECGAMDGELMQEIAEDALPQESSVRDSG